MLLNASFVAAAPAAPASPLVAFSAALSFTARWFKKEATRFVTARGGGGCVFMRFGSCCSVAVARATCRAACQTLESRRDLCTTLLVCCPLQAAEKRSAKEIERDPPSSL